MVNSINSNNLRSFQNLDKSNTQTPNQDNPQFKSLQQDTVSFSGILSRTPEVKNIDECVNLLVKDWEGNFFHQCKRFLDKSAIKQPKETSNGLIDYMKRVKALDDQDTTFTEESVNIIKKAIPFLNSKDRQVIKSNLENLIKAAKDPVNDNVNLIKSVIKNYLQN